MAPVPSHPPPSLHDFHASSPRISLIIFGIFAFALTLLLGYGLNKFVAYIRRRQADRSSWPSYVEPSTLRSLILPRLLGERATKKRAWRDWKNEQKPSYYDSGHAHADTADTAGTSSTRRLWIFRFNTTSRSGFSKSSSAASPQSSCLNSPTPPPMSPASKAWLSEHDHYWALQHELQSAGGPLCPGELIPWVPYIPRKPSASSALDVEHLTTPAPCVVKGRRIVGGFAKSTPNVSRAPILSIIQEVASETNLKTLASSQMSLYSQDSAESLVEDSIPSIGVKGYPNASSPANKHTDFKLNFLELYKYDINYLQDSTLNEKPTSSTPVLGSVSRSNRSGPFNLAPALSHKRTSCYSKVNIFSRHKENAPPPGWF